MTLATRWATGIGVASGLVLTLWLAGNLYGAWYLAHGAASHGAGFDETADPLLQRDLAALSPEDVRVGPKGLEGWYAEGRTDRPGWVLVHGGGGGNRTSEVSRARALHNEGYSVLALELSYASGAPFGGGSRESREIATALQWLASRTGGRRPLLYGCSAGAFSVLNAAADGAPVAAVVADSAFESTLRVGAERGFPRVLAWPMTLLYPLVSEGAQLRDLKGRFERGGLPMPALIIHGTGDEDVDPAHGRDLARATGAELWAPLGVGHCAAFQARPAEFVERLVRLANRAS